MSDGAGPVLLDLMRALRLGLHRGRRHAQRAVARDRWDWDARPELDRIVWKWPRRID
jgi:hypothetical protein